MVLWTHNQNPKQCTHNTQIAFRQPEIYEETIMNHTKKQPEIRKIRPVHGQLVVACGWAGAVV